MNCKTCVNANNCLHALTRRVVLILLAGLRCPWRLPRLGMGLVDAPGEAQ